MLWIKRGTTNRNLLEVKLEISTFIKNGIILLRTKEGKQIKEESGDLVYKETDIEHKRFNFPYSDLARAFEDNSKLSSTIVIIISMIFAITSPISFVYIVQIFQMLEIVTFLDIKLPLNFFKFVKMFSVSPFSVVPNIIHIDESNMENDIHNLLQDCDKNALLVNNSTNLFLIIVIFFISRIIIAAFKKISKRISKIFDGFLGLGFFYKMLFAMQIEMTISALINLRDMDLGGIIFFSNGVLSMAVITAYFYLNKTWFHRSVDLEVEKRRYGSYMNKRTNYELRQWVFIKRGFKERVAYILTLKPIFNSLRNLMICMVVIMMIEKPFTQISMTLVIFLISLVLNSVGRPYKNQRIDFLLVAQDTYFSLILIVCLSIGILEPQDANGEKYFGIILISLTIVILCWILVDCMASAYMAIRLVFKKRRRNISSREMEIIDVSYCPLTLFSLGEPTGVEEG